MSAIQPAPAAVTNPMTADQFWNFCNLPENENRTFDLIRGKVVEMPRPTRRHGIVAVRIAHLLTVWTYSIKHGYVAGNDSGVLLEEDPATVVGPDVAYFTDANTFAEVHPKWGEEPPVLAVEVLSPNDRMSRVNAKILDYHRNGVPVVWLVDYEDQQVTVYRPNQSHVMFGVGDTLDGGAELPGFSCPVVEIFRLPGDYGPVPTPLPAN